MRTCGILLILVSFAAPAFAQQVDVQLDITNRSGDTLIIRKGGKVITAEQYAKRYVPRKALLYSAVLPGMGQVYNKKYWKLPIVYGGFYMLTWVAFSYNDLYNKYKTELYAVVREPGYVPPSGYTEAQLRSVTEFYRRQRDFFLILDGMWYLLQLVDAHVDAHLRDFDLNPQLKLSLGPSIQQNSLYGQAAGMSITLKFR
ncbi:MAG: hypothetical protein JNK10_10970 [Cyclobacteriaceae bacterium]|nr:hypothetical protein [Cyclobacteriaceae bacterium]